MSPQTFSVLVVDREQVHRNRICATLAANGFCVSDAESGERALNAVRKQSFDVVLLDAGIPGMSGIVAVRALTPHTGIISVTARGSEEDIVQALEAGADDCVTKPFQRRELVARLRAIARRRCTKGTGRPKKLQAGALILDLERRALWKAGTEVNLSPTEFGLLEVLMRNAGVPLTRLDLLRAVWGQKCFNEPQYLRTYINRLRQKIEDNPGFPRYILTEPWIGYCFRGLSSPVLDSGETRQSTGEFPSLSALDPDSGQNSQRKGEILSPSTRGPDNGQNRRSKPAVSNRRRAVRYRIPSDSPIGLDNLRIDQLREAIQENSVSFPSQVPTFERHAQPDLQRKLVQLYFVCGWSCEGIASRYRLDHHRVRQILNTWKGRAIETGYLQYIPPAEPSVDDAQTGRSLPGAH